VIGRDLTVAPKDATMGQDAEADLGVIRDYQLLSKIGAGGMGTVYKALHTRLQKIVALKVLPDGRMDDPQAVERFEREMQAVGRLSHPNIVGAHDAGEHEGTHFLVMEHVAGVDLSELIRQTGPLPIADACELVRQAAVGLQHAHEHDLVHRDIKPSNLMLAPDGQLKILDLGLARLHTTGQQELTSTGQMMGTLDYIAPEQTGDSHDVDIRADIFSLGATLYKLLTGVTPYSDPRYNTAVKRLAALANDPIPPVQDRRNDVPAELATVVSRMLAKDPDDRFGTPAEVAQALEPFAAGAEPAALLARTQQSTPEEDAPVSVENSTAPHLSSFTDTDFYRNDPANVPSEAFDDASQQAAPELEPTFFQPAAGASRSTRTPRRTIVACALVGLGILLSGVIVFRLNLPAGTIVLECDPAALAGAKIEINGEEVTIKLAGDNAPVTIGVDARRGELRITKADFKVFTKAFEIAVGEDEHSIKVTFEPLLVSIPDPAQPDWQPGPAEDVLPGLVARPTNLPGVKRWQVETTAPRSAVYSVDWSPDGRLVACGSTDGAVRIYEGQQLGLVRLLAGHRGEIRSVAWSPDGSVLATGSTDGTIRLWNTDGTPGPVLRGHTNDVYAVTWSPDGKQLASAGLDHTVRIWDSNGEEKQVFDIPSAGGLRTVAWSPDGKRIALGHRDNTIRLRSLDGGAEVILKGHTAGVYSIAWSPDGKTLASGSRDKTIRLWNPDGTSRLVLDEHDGQVNCIAWSQDGEFFASGSGDQTIRLWKADGTAVSTLQQKATARSLAWNPDGERIVAGYLDTTMRVVNTDGTPGPVVSSGRGVLRAVVGWSPDGGQLAAGHGGGGGPGEVQLWGVDGAPRTTLQGPGGYCLAWRPDGLALASGALRTWQLLKLDGTRGAILTDDGVIDSVAWSPDGRQVSWASSEKNAVRLSASDGTPGPVLEGAYSVGLESGWETPGDGKPRFDAADLAS
jgi:WD40 repeat protein/serine/threonine protein kinase